MSIKLTNLLLKNHNLTSNLTQSEKHILMIFCYRADEQNETWSSIELLAKNCCSCKKTVERNLKKLRDKKFLIPTEKFKGKMKRIPVYRLNLNHGQIGGDLNLITDNLSLNDGQFVPSNDGQFVHIERSFKDNKEESKPFSFLTAATLSQKVLYHEYVMRTKQDIALNLLSADTCVMTPDEWIKK